MRQCIEDRDGSINQILSGVLAKQAAGAGLLPASHRISILVNRLGQELVVAAQAHLKQLAEETAVGSSAQADAQAKLRALQKLNWRFVVIDDDQPNAFVAETLPGFCFIHRGLVELMKDDDSLSFALGHELSHYLCSHGSSDGMRKGIFSALQLLVLAACDPTGLVSVALELPIFDALISYTVALPISRRNELEADSLGLELVARACRDPERAIKAHERLATLEQQAGRDPQQQSLASTHPATLERLSALQEQLPAAIELYEANGCARIKTALKRLYKTYNGSKP